MPSVALQSTAPALSIEPKDVWVCLYEYTAELAHI